MQSDDLADVFPGTLRTTFGVADCRGDADIRRWGSCYCGKFRAAEVRTEARRPPNGPDPWEVR